MDEQQQQISNLAATMRAVHAATTPKQSNRATWESWVEGPRKVAALLDSGIQGYGLERTYWHVHKTGWLRVRVVFGVAGDSRRLAAFKAAVDEWAAGAA